jgi:hypothetical protein
MYGAALPAKKVQNAFPHMVSDKALWMGNLPLFCTAPLSGPVNFAMCILEDMFLFPALIHSVVDNNL